MKYIEYLQTPEWKSMRARAVERHGNHCHCCGSTLDVHIHHITYANGWGSETVDDLMPLCEWHHDKIHAEPRLDWMLHENATPNAVKRKVILYFLRTGSVPSIELAEREDEQACTVARRHRSKARTPKAVRVKKDPANEQAKRVWHANRLHERGRAMKEFGLLQRTRQFTPVEPKG